MFPKGGMNKLMKQAQEMQAKMSKIQDQLNELEIEGQSGGGLVSAVVNGKKELLSISLDNEAINEDKEMLEDLIVAAVNSAMHNANKIAEEKMGSVTGGLMGNMKFPGM